jgi:hypothetical protein
MKAPSRNVLRILSAAMFPLAGIAIFGLGQAWPAGEDGEVRLLLVPENPPAVRDAAWRRVGSSLTALYEQYEAHRAKSPQTPFSAGIAALQVADDYVVIDAVAEGEPELLVAYLEDLGAVRISRFKHVVSTSLPLGAIPKLAEVRALRFARPALAVRRTGLTTTQGDQALKADLARQTFGVDGSGVTVGVLSDSFDCLSGASGGVVSGDLPPDFLVLAEPADCGGKVDEARAMAEIVHDIAPGAGIMAHTAFAGQADFALGIQELAGCPPGSEVGCSAVITSTLPSATVIVDDVGYFSEPFFQDGIIAQAVDFVTENGVSYYSAAGNSARASYEGPFVSSSTDITPFDPIPHDFDPGQGVDTLQKITLGNGYTDFSLQWDSPYASVTGSFGTPNEMRVCFWTEPAGLEPVDCTTPNGQGGDPIEVFWIYVSSASATLNVSVEHVSGPAPGYFKWIAFRPDVLIEEYNTASSTLYGHPNAEGAIAVGAAFYKDTPAFGVDPPELEWFSSAGGTPVYTEVYTMTIESPVVRAKPEIVAPDGGNTTFFGVPDADPDGCCEKDGFPNFFGTSAAAPHAAAVGALVQSSGIITSTLQITPSGLRDVLESSAADDDMGAPGFDFDSGHGFLGALQAVGAVDPNSTVFAPKILTLDSGFPGGGTFNATDEVYISVVFSNTATVRSPLTVLDDGAILSNVTFADFP